jgi:cell wall-associated NlpC family hydrolase
MTETIPSSLRTEPSLRPLLPFFFVLLAALGSFSFKSINKAPANRANDAEIMQYRTDITGYAQNFTGLRYRYAGRSPKTGFDCSGFTSFILDEFNVNVSSCSRTQSTQGVKIALDEVLPGDLVFFGRPGRIQHVAMVVEKTAEGVFCVHSTCTRGIVVENISTSKYWKPKILFARDVISGQAI